MPEWKNVEKDGLPHDDRRVVVTLVGIGSPWNNIPWIDVARCMDGEWLYYDPDQEWVPFDPKHFIVLAWMDLRPYEGE